MRFLLISFTILQFCSGCSQGISIEQYSSLIVGNWYPDKQMGNQYYSPDQYLFSFSKDSCTVGGGFVSHYSFNHDTLTISKKGGFYYLPYIPPEHSFTTVTFPIFFKDSNSIVFPTTGISNHDTVYLHRLMSINTEAYERIGFRYRSWYESGFNETQYFELDKNGNIWMKLPDLTEEQSYGIREPIIKRLNVTDTLQYLLSGRISKKDQAEINELIQTIPLDTLKDIYRAGGTHPSTSKILIKTKENIFLTTNKSNSLAPPGLKMLENRLKHIYLKANLKLDKKANRNFELTDFFNTIK